MEKEEIINFCTNLIDKSQLRYLTTIDEDGFPISRAIFNLQNSSKFPTIKKIVSSPHDPFYTIIATNTDSKKIEELKQNPKATLYYCVPDKFQGLSLSGTMNFLHDLDLKQKLWVDGWEIFYPQGYTDPDFCVLQLNPHYARGWHGSGKYAFRISYDKNAIHYKFS